jgi:hypothetical protein
VRTFLLLLLCSCATPQAIARRGAEAQLKECVYGSVLPASVAQKRHCLAEAHTYCRSQGLEDTCASDGLFVDQLSQPLR